MTLLLLLILAAFSLDGAVSAHHCVREAQSLAFRFEQAAAFRRPDTDHYLMIAEDYRWDVVRYRIKRFNGFAICGALVTAAFAAGYAL